LYLLPDLLSSSNLIELELMSMPSSTLVELRFKMSSSKA
jgi:hypothetical protein